MASRSYPHYTGKSQGKKGWFENGVKCEICDKPAFCFADFQWSFFRGDDESYRVCEEHFAMTRTDPKRLASLGEAARIAKRAGLT